MERTHDTRQTTQGEMVPGSWFLVLVDGWTRINSPFEGGQRDVHRKNSELVEEVEEVKRLKGLR